MRNKLIYKRAVFRVEVAIAWRRFTSWILRGLWAVIHPNYVRLRFWLASYRPEIELGQVEPVIPVEQDRYSGGKRTER
jgi:hypothetical protein